MNQFPVCSVVTDKDEEEKKKKKRKRLLFTVWNCDGASRYSSIMTIISDVFRFVFRIKHQGS